MIRTQIQLESWQYEALKRRSSESNRSMADLIREAVSESLQRSRPFPALQEIAGKYAPGPVDGLKAHDEQLAALLR